MKRVVAILFIIFSTHSYGQSFTAASLNADMHNLYNAYLKDFKTIWGKRKLATDSEIVYHSIYRVTGSVDRSCFVIYNKTDRTFAFTAVMDSQYVNAKKLNEAFRKVQLPVGKLTELEQQNSPVRYYELANKDAAPYKAKKLLLVVTNAPDNISWENAREYSFKIIAVEEKEDRLVKAKPGKVPQP